MPVAVFCALQQPWVR